MRFFLLFFPDSASVAADLFSMAKPVEANASRAAVAGLTSPRGAVAEEDARRASNAAVAGPREPVLLLRPTAREPLLLMVTMLCLYLRNLKMADRPKR